MSVSMRERQTRKSNKNQKIHMLHSTLLDHKRSACSTKQQPKRVNNSKNNEKERERETERSNGRSARGWRLFVSERRYFLFVYLEFAQVNLHTFSLCRAATTCAKVVINKISIKMIMYANSSRSTSLLLLLVVINNNTLARVHTHTVQQRRQRQSHSVCY